MAHLFSKKLLLSVSLAIASVATFDVSAMEGGEEAKASDSSSFSHIDLRSSYFDWLSFYRQKEFLSLLSAEQLIEMAKSYPLIKMVMSDDCPVEIDDKVIEENLIEMKENLGCIDLSAILGALATKTESLQALSFFKPLVRQRLWCEQALEIALENSKHDDWKARCRTLQLLAALIEQGYGYDQVLEWALENRKHNDLSVRYEALKLLKALVKQGCEAAYEPALEVAKANSAHDHWQVRYHWQIRREAIQLLKILIKQGYETAYEPALEVAKVNSTHDDWKARCRTLELIGALVVQGYEPAYDPALEVAKENSTHQNESVEGAARDLLGVLARKGFGVSTTS